jgi:hypothetical protein
VKFVALLIFMYFMVGLIGGIAVSEATSKKPFKSASPTNLHSERPPFELPLELLFLGILLGLPFLGYRRAKLRGEFLRFSPKVWLILPPSLLISGFIAGLLAFRFL